MVDFGHGQEREHSRGEPGRRPGPYRMPEDQRELPEHRVAVRQVTGLAVGRRRRRRRGRPDRQAWPDGRYVPRREHHHDHGRQRRPPVLRLVEACGTCVWPARTCR